MELKWMSHEDEMNRVGITDKVALRTLVKIKNLWNGEMNKDPEK